MSLPGWTCPALDRLAATLRRHVPEPERSEALAEVERLRLAHIRLRAAAHGTTPPPEEVERIEVRIRHLEAP